MDIVSFSEAFPPFTQIGPSSEAIHCQLLTHTNTTQSKTKSTLSSQPTHGTQLRCVPTTRPRQPQHHAIVLQQLSAARCMSSLRPLQHHPRLQSSPLRSNTPTTPQAQQPQTRREQDQHLQTTHPHPTPSNLSSYICRTHIPAQDPARLAKRAILRRRNQKQPNPHGSHGSCF